MNIKHLDIQISKEDPFLNCKLNRKPFANILTSIVKKYNNGFVFALNNEWGTGKTTFVKMWKQQLENENFKTLYFNAWENDFQSDPLIAIISELKSLDNSKAKETFKTVVNAAAPYAKKIIPVLIKAAVNKLLTEDGANELINAGVDVTAEELEDEIKSYNKKKEGIKEFKKNLTAYIEETLKDEEKESNNQKAKGQLKNEEKYYPIVFIIDELDRCRPNYAVETLEKLKHFFEVPGIIFVLAIDKLQLEAAVCGVYGSDNINAKEYLRRFIDLELSLPKPDIKTYCNYLYEYFQFDSFLNSEERLKYYDFNEDSKEIIAFTTLLFEIQNLTLRIQEKILAHARLVIDSFRPDNYLFPTLYIYLIYIKYFQTNFYNSIKDRRINYQELINFFESLFINKLNNSNIYIIQYTESILLLFYHNYYIEVYREMQLIEKDNNGVRLKIKSSFPYPDYEKNLLTTIQNPNRIYHREIKISHLLKKIDLTEPIYI